MATSERTVMTVSQVTDEVLYTGLFEMQELDATGLGQGRIVPHPTREVALGYIGFLFTKFFHSRGVECSILVIGPFLFPTPLYQKFLTKG